MSIEPGSNYLVARITPVFIPQNNGSHTDIQIRVEEAVRNALNNLPVTDPSENLTYVRISISVNQTPEGRDIFFNLTTLNFRRTSDFGRTFD